MKSYKVRRSVYSTWQIVEFDSVERRSSTVYESCNRQTAEAVAEYLGTKAAQEDMTPTLSAAEVRVVYTVVKDWLTTEYRTEDPQFTGDVNDLKGRLETVFGMKPGV